MLHRLPSYLPEDEDLVIIRRTLQTLRGYRRAIAFTFLLAAVLALTFGLFMYVRAPIVRTGTIRFRLLFDSAAQSRYPTGAPFSPSDITVEPILRQAYRSNDLHRFADYDTFRSSISVLASPPNPSALSLTMRWTDGVTPLAPELMEKVITQVLMLWADDTMTVKHTTRSDIAMLAKDLATLDAIEHEDYLVRAEILESHMNRAKRVIEHLETLPGGQAIRAGAHRRSLADVGTLLADVAEPAITALLDLVRVEGVSTNAAALRAHANNRLYHLRIDGEQSTQRIKALQEALVAYSNDMTSTVDVNAGSADAYRRRILDRIMRESERAETLKSQAAYYREVWNLPGGGNRAVGSPELQARATAHTKTALIAVRDAVEHLSAIYAEFSEGKLGVPGVYAVTAPFSTATARAVSLRTVALFVVLTLVLSAFLVPAACLLHASLRQRT